MIILNFSHPMTEEQEESIRTITNVNNEEWQETILYEIKCLVDIDKPLDSQIEKILSDIPQNAWDTNNRILINPPPISHSAILIMLGIYSKCGYFPELIRIKRKRKSSPPKYVVAEIIGAQRFKDHMRSQRQSKNIVKKLIGEK